MKNTIGATATTRIGCRTSDGPPNIITTSLSGASRSTMKSPGWTAKTKWTVATRTRWLRFSSIRSHTRCTTVRIERLQISLDAKRRRKFARTGTVRKNETLTRSCTPKECPTAYRRVTAWSGTTRKCTNTSQSTGRARLTRMENHQGTHQLLRKSTTILNFKSKGRILNSFFKRSPKFGGQSSRRVSRSKVNY